MLRFIRLSLLLPGLLLTLAWGQRPVKLAFWNVENLFDTTNAVQIQDDDFTPMGKYHWTEDRLAAKFQALSRVIHDLNHGSDLALIGLAEIENREVLQRLNSQYLQDHFAIIHKESPDERGIDCAILYDPKLLKLEEKDFIPIWLSGDERTRDIIEAVFQLQGQDTPARLHVFINHWPSRWGGEEATAPYRKTTALTLRTRIDELLTENPQADIIILGDFNDYPDDPSLLQVLRAGPSASYPGDLINTTWPINMDPAAGTVMYRGDWKVFDQIIISAGLMDLHGFSWAPHSTQVFHPGYLIEDQGKFAGWPFRTYRRGKYQAGYSDHLPLTCQINYSLN